MEGLLNDKAKRNSEPPTLNTKRLPQHLMKQQVGKGSIPNEGQSLLDREVK
jgi:hypothetical protein